MCISCGCSDTGGVTLTTLSPDENEAMNRAEHDRVHALGLPHEHPHDQGKGGGHGHGAMSYRPRTTSHAHGQGHPHAHANEYPGNADVVGLHARTHGTTVELELDILAKNQYLAEHNRQWFVERGILALNLMSSPGSGKTTLLERTIRDLRDQYPIQVIEGDQATINDAERIRATGCKVVQINTGTGCHLDADMLAHGLAQLNPSSASMLMIENVGNLVCPALFDLGEQAKVVILSVTEGEDKPIKYPHMFRASRVMLLNKIDLLPHLRFDVERCIAYARLVNPGIMVFRVSAETGEGMADWYAWLRDEMVRVQQTELVL